MTNNVPADSVANWSVLQQPVAAASKTPISDDASEFKTVREKQFSAIP